jgi:hypothetical protein
LGRTIEFRVIRAKSGSVPELVLGAAIVGSSSIDSYNER